MKLGNKYYKNKRDERWVIYSSNIEATRITSDWYLWIHHTINKIPDDKENKLERSRVMSCRFAFSTVPCD